MALPSGSELARPFVPARDFGLSKRFYETLGFEKLLDGVDSWWDHINELDLPTRFGVPKPKAPALQPWGLRVAFLVDPSGVLWHVAQRHPGN